MSSRRPHLLAVAAAVAGVLATVGGLLSPAAAAAHNPPAMVRGGHFSPDTPGVDVYLTSFAGKTTKLWLSGVAYGDVSSYRPLMPGLYAVSMRPHGAARSTPAALTWTLNAQPGQAYTACAVGMNADLQGVVLHDDLRPTPPGQVRVRVIQAASRAKHANVTLAGGPSLAHNAPFATATKYTTVPVGRHVIKASAVGDPTLRATTRMTWKPDTVHTVVVLDAKGHGITLSVLDDATGAAVEPVGAAPAGGGGTATTPDHAPSSGVLAAVITVLLVGSGLFLVTGRSRRG